MIELRQVAWTPGHAEELTAALAGDPLASITEFQRWVEDGAAILFDVHDGKRLGSVLITAEQVNGHNQAVIVAGAGRATLGQLRQALAALVAQLRGFDSIRTHVQRPALVRLWRGLGFEQAEIVMRKANG